MTQTSPPNDELFAGLLSDFLDESQEIPHAAQRASFGAGRLDGRGTRSRRTL